MGKGRKGKERQDKLGKGEVGKSVGKSKEGEERWEKFG